MGINTGGIGGMPSVPNVDASMSAKKLALAEELLQKAVLKVNELAEDYPKLQAILQASLNLIKASFAKIIQIKYHENVKDIIQDLSPEQVDALTAQINAVTAQVNTLTADIVAQNALISQQQQRIAANNVLLLFKPGDPAILAENAALSALIVTEQAQIQTDLNQINTLNASLVPLQQQLQTAQMSLDAAIAEFHSFTPTEQALFRLLYPNVHFPV